MNGKAKGATAQQAGLNARAKLEGIDAEGIVDLAGAGCSCGKCCEALFGQYCVSGRAALGLTAVASANNFVEIWHPKYGNAEHRRIARCPTPPFHKPVAPLPGCHIRFSNSAARCLDRLDHLLPCGGCLGPTPSL